MHPFLLPTQKVAQAWLTSGDRHTRILPTAPDNAEVTEEDVIIYPDDSWAFISRASRPAAWITGPNRDLSREESWEDQSIYCRD
jgi:hypothetical protein